jgi:hypothetical protein
MNTHNAENWEIVKITGDDPHYRVFASWRGGYASSDSWRMNSGITSVTEDEDYYYFKGHSGSVYKCHKQTYGNLGFYNLGVLEDYCDKSGGHMHRVEEMPDIMNMDWII